MIREFENIETPEKFLQYLDNISYGWYGIDGLVRKDSLKGFKEYYKTMSNEEVLKYKVGTCPEQVNLIKYFLDIKKIKNKILAIVGYESIGGIDKERVHFMIIYEINNIWYQIEHASRFFRGIFKYGTIEEAKNKILDKYKKILKKSILIELKEIPIGIDYIGLRELVLKNIK